MRILFMGGKHAGCGCLKFLIDRAEEIAGTFVCADDEAPNRWYPSAVEIAKEADIPVHRVEDINQPATVALIKKLNPEAIVLVEYDQLPDIQLYRELAPKGIIQLSLCLVNRYRGYYPITWALLDEEQETGASLYYLTEKKSTVQMVGQVKIPIHKEDTAGILYEHVAESGLSLFKTAWEYITIDKIKPRSTDLSSAAYHGPEYPSRKLDFTKSGKELLSQIRAHLFPPYPPPYIQMGDQRLDILPRKKTTRAQLKEIGTDVRRNPRKRTTMFNTIEDGWFSE